MITRRHLFSAAGGLVAFSATPAVAAEAEPRIGFMEIKRNGSQPSGKGPADYFTGTVRIDPLFQASEPARGTGASVTFEPGARTAWHTHPLGQTLIVTAGVGRVQRWGGPVEEIRPGDVVWFPSGEKHWHGASPTTAMTHIAIQERLDGKVVDWLEHVTVSSRCNPAEGDPILKPHARLHRFRQEAVPGGTRRRRLSCRCRPWVIRDRCRGSYYRLMSVLLRKRLNFGSPRNDAKGQKATSPASIAAYLAQKVGISRWQLYN